MKNLFSLLTVAALVAAPAMALDNKEKGDLRKIGADAKGASGDQAAAKKLRESAAAHAKAAVAAFQAANKFWEQRQAQITVMHNQNAAAARDRNAANALDKDAARLIQAENMRAAAFRDRIEADAFHKAAHNHRVNANAAAQAIADGNIALVFLKKDGTKFANAIRDIETDIAAQKTKQAAELAAAAKDVERANVELKQAADLEQKAAALERPAVAVPVLQVKAPVAPPAIQAVVKK